MWAAPRERETLCSLWDAGVWRVRARAHRTALLALVARATLLWTGVFDIIIPRQHPGRTDKNICRFFGAPVCRLFFLVTRINQ